MTSSNGIIAVNVSGKAMFFNDKGRGLSTYASRSDIADICILNSRQAAVITRTYIAVVDI